ncbi:restriction endonuclease subunit S [Pseudomonas sp. zbq_18]|uniref:restriction endonuclease subunit S n=1 Tax=Pseudomonadota TaxID=1224 RepID=UPI003709FC2C
MTFPAYSAYRDSGVDWLGEVPLGWRVGNLKHALIELVSGGTPESNNSAYWSDGDGIPWVAISDMTRGPIVDCTAKSLTAAGLKSKGLRVIPAGGLLYSIYASIGKVAVLGLNAATNQAILGLLLDGKVAEQSFVKWWLVSLESWVKTMASSNTQDNLNAEKVRNLPLVFPTLLEQTQIAHFLDHETARIDALIEEQQRLIELLKEKRQAVISHAITKGLNPAVPMKDSGVEWLGEVPAHWDVVALKRIVEVKDGTHATPSYVDPSPDAFPLITSKDFIGTNIDFDNCKYISSEDHSEVMRRSDTQNGDVLMSMIGGNIGKALIVETSREFSIKNVALFKSAGSSKKAKQILYFLESRLFEQQTELISRGGAQGFLGLGDIRSLVIPKPPEGELSEILRFLAVQVPKLDSLIEVAGEAIRFMNERRSALISAAVTGKIDVRGWQPPASTQAPEPAVAEAV